MTLIFSWHGNGITVASLALYTLIIVCVSQPTCVYIGSRLADMVKLPQQTLFHGFSPTMGSLKTIIPPAHEDCWHRGDPKGGQGRQSQPLICRLIWGPVYIVPEHRKRKVHKLSIREPIYKVQRCIEHDAMIMWRTKPTTVNLLIVLFTFRNSSQSSELTNSKEVCSNNNALLTGPTIFLLDFLSCVLLPYSIYSPLWVGEKGR